MLSGVVMALPATVLHEIDASTLSGAPQRFAVRSRRGGHWQRRILRLRRGPYPGSAQDAPQRLRSRYRE